MPRIKKSHVKIRRPRLRNDPKENALAGALRKLLLPVGLFLIAGILGTTFILWKSGWIDKQVQNLVNSAYNFSRHAGFSVEEILVEGRNQTDREKILQVLDVKKGSPILAFDPHEALAKLGSISWVKTGTVERRLPSTIYVRLSERTPIAIWQNNKRFYLIDQEGHPLREAGPNENLGLPHVVGHGAEKEAADLLSRLVLQPSIFSRMRAAVRVGGRRWDLHMQNRSIVKLPEENADAALKRLAKLISDQRILDRDIKTLDMRLPDRLIMEKAEQAEPAAAKPAPGI
jgi:cell division protein FtsQ